MFQTCAFHGSEDVVGAPTGDEAGSLSFTCDRKHDHPTPGPWTWLHVPEPAGVPGLGGIASRLRLDIELPAAIAKHRHRWLEFGIVERTYALQCPQDFAELIQEFGHRGLAPSKHTVSAFLARALGNLSRTGHVLYRPGTATGRWAYNSTISWWALPPEPDWQQRLSWADANLDLDYLPGSTPANT